MPVINDLRQLIADVLQLGDRAATFDAETPLLGSVPELDSMAVVGVISAIEQRFGIVIDDDDISATTFSTLGSLTEFIEKKLDESERTRWQS